MKEYRLQRGRWEENQPRTYKLVLQHCPPELETQLTTHPKWDQVRLDYDVLSLLGMIRNIAHNHDKAKLGLMAIIEYDMELYLGFQGPNEPYDDYMAVFKTRIDRINAHGGLSGKHPGHLNELFGRIIEERELTKDKIKNLSPKEKLILQTEVQEMACEEYPTLLFIKQADKTRYSELKTTLANEHLNPNA